MTRGPYKGSFLYKLQHMNVDAVCDAIKSCTSVIEISKKLGLQMNGSSYPTFKKFAIEHGIDISHFTGTTKGRPSKLRLKEDDVFVVGRKMGRYYLSKFMIESGDKYICAECSQEPIWCGKTLKLHVDHIDGNNKNNVHENLRFLCPNCHTQTETWGWSKHRSNKKRSVI